MEKALVIKNLKKTYSNGTVALKGVSLEIPQGDFFALLGPNGAGKTSIIGVIIGLVLKTEGEVKVFGTNLNENPEEARRLIGVVPQELNFNIFEKVIDIVVNQGGYYGIPRSVAIPRAEEILKGLGLYEKRHDMSMTLSGGMKRRLLIARALIHQPKFLVLDEPTAGVDVELRRGMWEFLKTLTAKGVTILLTTHYLEEAEQLCKHIAIINKGEIVAHGTMKEVLSKLNTETIILDFKSVISDAILKLIPKFNPHRVDENTIEIQIGEGHSIGEAIVSLENSGASVQGVRQKSGRLEEVFVNLTQASE